MPGRRPLFAFVALFAASLPACLHISATPSAPVTPSAEATKIAARGAETTPQPPRMEFAVLPRAPGTVVPKTGTNTNTASLKPTPAPAPAPKAVEPVRPVAAEPQPFPVVMQPAPLPEAPLLAAVRAYTESRPDRAIEIIRTLNTPNQDLILALLPILARGASTDLNNDPATVAALVEQLHAAAHRLEPRAALRIEKSMFCKHVDGFGRYTPWPDNQPYRPHGQVQFYLEVRNLGSQPVGTGFETRVNATVEIRDAHGKLVDQIHPKDVNRRVPVMQFDRGLPSNSPLHDFHVLLVFSAPPAPGVYEITVELRDPVSRRTVKTQPVRFDVAGP